MNSNDRAARRGRRIWQTQRDRSRGYSISRKALAAAIGIEIAIIASSLYASYIFAEKYAGSDAASTQVAALQWFNVFGDHSLDWRMAIVGGVATAFAEIARLPLAAASRTQASFAMRCLAFLGLLMMAFVTTKAMAQVMQQAYAPRIHHVQMLTKDVKIAESGLDVLKAKRGTADAVLKPLEQDVRDAQERVDDLNTRISEQGQAPKTICSPIWKKNKAGKSYKAGQKCTTPKWAGQQFADQLPEAMTVLQGAIAKRDEATRGVGHEAEAIAAQETHVAELQGEQREAVTDSVVHGLAGIFYGIDPLDVTEDQVNGFMRLFVLVPSLMIALASSLLIMVAYTRIPRPRAVQPIIVQVPAAVRGAASEGTS